MKSRALWWIALAALVAAGCAGAPAPVEEKPAAAEEAQVAPPAEGSAALPAAGPVDPAELAPLPPPPTPEELLSWARTAYEAKRYDEAVGAILRAKESAPDLPGALPLEARIRFDQEDAERGLPLLETLILEGEVGERETLDTYVLWADRSGETARAAAFLAPLVEGREREDPALTAAAGWAHYRAGDVERALKTWNAIEATPEIFPFALLASRLYFTRGDANAAMRLARIAAREPTLLAAASLALADIQRAQGRSGAAEQLYGKILKDAPDDYATLVSYGLMKLGQGSSREAAELFERATKAREDLPEAWNDLGLARRALGEYTKARAAYEKALEVSPNHTPAIKNLAILVEKYLGKPSEALPIYDRYLALHPDDEEVGRWRKAAERLAGEAAR